jgi:hypothetical protein
VPRSPDWRSARSTSSACTHGSNIGIFSGGAISLEDVEASLGFTDKVRLVFVSYGSRELNGSGPVRVGNPRETTDALQKAGIKSAFYVSPNTAHEFLTWRRSLREFAPLLFRE